MIHTNAKKSKILVTRESPRHKWQSYLHATDKKSWVRYVHMLDHDKYFENHQKGYITFCGSPLPNSFWDSEYEVKSLPEVDWETQGLIKAIENFFNSGVTGINPPIIGAFVELGILQGEF